VIDRWCDFASFLFDGFPLSFPWNDGARGRSLKPPTPAFSGAALSNPLSTWPIRAHKMSAGGGASWGTRALGRELPVNARQSKDMERLNRHGLSLNGVGVAQNRCGHRRPPTVGGRRPPAVEELKMRSGSGRTHRRFFRDSSF